MTVKENKNNGRKWPKTILELTEEQSRIREDFVHYWHTVLPRKYGIIEKFNHGYPAARGLLAEKCKTLEIGAALGEHLEYERIQNQEYIALELREEMAREIKKRFPEVQTVVGDCQERIPAEDSCFDRVLAIHVLEHLPNLPAALQEIYRVLKDEGDFIAVIPCEGGIAYRLARNYSARKIFESRYGQSYDWFVKIEHINMSGEILEEIKRFFNIKEADYFPLKIPIIGLNLCIGLVMNKRNRLIKNTQQG